MADRIGSRIDRLMDMDFSSITSEQVIGIIAGGSLTIDDQARSVITGENLTTGDEALNLPYDDIQTKEGFERELGRTQKDVDSVIESLKPGPPPIPMERIEELACNYEGDQLYSAIILETLKNDEPTLYDSLINSDEFKNDSPVTESDIGVSVTNINLDAVVGKSGSISGIESRRGSSDITRGRSSSGITKYLRDKNPELLDRINERIFDNLDPIIVGKPSNSGAKKKRKLNVLGFKIPLVFIMAGTRIVHVKIGGEEISFDKLIKKINKLLKDQYANAKPCDFNKSLDLRDFSRGARNNELDEEEEINLDEIIDVGTFDEFDGNFYPDGDDPVQINDDCFAGIPEDPITGDPIATKQKFEQITEEFCDPIEESDIPQSPLEDPIEVPDPVTEDVDVEAIEGCLNAALQKTDQLQDEIKKLSRWQSIERSLEEILYHYEAIYEYHKTLASEWKKNASDGTVGANSDLGIAIQALTYRDQLSNYSEQILQEQGDYSNDKKDFLGAFKIFNDKIFNINIAVLDLTEKELKKFIKEGIDRNNEIIIYDDSNSSWPISTAVTIISSNKDIIRDYLLKKRFIDKLKSDFSETKNLLQASLDKLSERKKKTVNIQDLEKLFTPDKIDLSDPYGQGEDTLSEANRVLKGHKFLDLLKEFSVRYETDISKSRGELIIKLSLPTDYGNPIPYIETEKPAKFSLKGSTESTVTVNIPDLPLIRLGNEYANNGGLLAGRIPSFLISYQSLKINNLIRGQKDVADFYDFLEKIIDTDDSKESIIKDIVEDRGILYGELIEKSSSNWLFFSAAERGDNNSRDPAKLRPAGFTDEGDPNPVFVEFNSNFKPKWDAKYRQAKNIHIVPAIDKLKKEARKAATSLAEALSKNEAVGIRIFENYFDVKKKYEDIQETMLFAAQKIAELNDSISPEGIEKKFSGIDCGAGSRRGPSGRGNAAAGAGGGAEASGSDPENCPPPCCGKAGSDFKTPNYLKSCPPSSDCPTIFQRCWWQQFCKDVTKVGLMPFPNGLPPIEKKEFFLVGGPSVRLGLKYWPVGYLPPAFIPIPIPNPVDGAPYIRIPLPMIWTIIKPILIPLPFNLGLMVIFIPFIGGFMPTPLVYIKEFLTGGSFFLTGLRGPRFIPRKSDPKIKDPFEKIKQMLTYGIPDNLLPLPGFGKDNLDSKDRVLEDLKANLSKIMDTITPPGNMQGVRDLQTKELALKNQIFDKVRQYENQFALDDNIKFPDLTTDVATLNSIVGERKIVLRNTIKTYLKNSIPTPKDIYFPKGKSRLKIDISGILRSMRILKEMKTSLVPIKCPNFIDFKEEMREALKLMKIVCPPRYAIENLDVANSSKLFLRKSGDPRFMTDDEFKELVRPIRRASIIITAVILWGNKISTIKKLREGIFSIIDLGEYEGEITFPPVKITNSAPIKLKLFKRRDPEIKDMMERIIKGLARTEYTIDDFVKYVRYNGEDPSVIIRVKDLKKIISRKLGLSAISQFDPVRPLDAEEPLISRYPYPKGTLACLESLNGKFGNAVAAFEFPVKFPPKQDSFLQIPGLGGVIQIKIKGKDIKSVLIDLLDKAMENGVLEANIPEINDPFSTRFTDLGPLDIQKISKNIITNLINPNAENLPPIFNILNKKILPNARPTDIIEQALIGLGSPPFARMPQGNFWEYYKSQPKTPLSDLVVFPKLKASADVISKLPWPLTILMGRGVLNLLNPMLMNDDHPVWRRMSLRNSYYVAYIDEFLRSAADVSGLFKFFFGSLSDPAYPIKELKSEIKTAWNEKKF